MKEVDANAGTWKNRKKRLDNPEVKAASGTFGKDFSFFDELLKAKMKRGFTQAEVARRMGTITPVVARMETDTFSVDLDTAQVRPCRRLPI
jgi:hypothetical protein